MSTNAYKYNFDGAMVFASGESFSSIRYNKHNRLPVELSGGSGEVYLRYDSFGRRLHKDGAALIFYRNGVHHPAADRNKEPESGNELHHALVEMADEEQVVYLFTPAGQTVLRRACGYARAARDHLRSVRVEAMMGEAAAARYSAFGKSIVTGGRLLRGFAGYELDVESGLYNAHRRLYAPWLGIFVSVDPQLENASPYLYCNNEPFNRIDPTGENMSAVISGIIAGLLLVAGVIATVFTFGAATPVVTLDMDEFVAIATAADAGGNGCVASSIAEHIPSQIAHFAKLGAQFGFAASVVNNGAQLAAQAAQGEHISAWQTVKSMLLAPVAAAATGAMGGAIAGVGLQATTALGASYAFAMSALGGAASSLADSAANAALDVQIAKWSEWEYIGIQMAVAVGEALAMAPFFATVLAAPAGTYRAITVTKTREPLTHIAAGPGLRARLSQVEYNMSVLSKQSAELTPHERLRRFFRHRLLVADVFYSRQGQLECARMAFNYPDRYLRNEWD